MWWIKKPVQALITIVFEDRALVFSLLQRIQSHIMLHAYKKIPILNDEIFDGIIYHTEFLRKHLSDFIHTHRVSSQLPLAICAHDAILVEHFYKTDSHHIDIVSVHESLHQTVWEAHYLCPSIEHDGFWYYLCGMRREHINHYTLLAHELGLDIVLLTSCIMAYIQLYKYRQMSTFRQSQLSLDFTTNECSLTNLITPELVANTLHVSNELTISFTDEYKNLGVALGLFLARE